jgi:hypothetical protein
MDRTKEELMFTYKMIAKRQEQLWKRWKKYRSAGQMNKAREMRYELDDLLNEMMEVSDMLDKYNIKVIKNIHGKLEFIDKE